MKKKTILYIIAGVAVLVLILVLTKQFPPVTGDEISGTIGKVDKYRKVQMTDRDIILRSQFVSDTSLLSSSIKGLDFFNNIIKQYSSDLLVCAEHLRINEPSFKNTKALINYTKYIDKNINSLENTIKLLSDFYNGDTSNYSIDIEKKLNEFNAFYNQFLLKDSIVNKTLKELENNVSLGIVNMSDKKEGLKILKNIHDQMLIKKFQVNVATKNAVGVSQSLDFVLYHQSNLGVILENKVDLNGIEITNKAVQNGIIAAGFMFNKSLDASNVVQSRSLGQFIQYNKLQGIKTSLGPTIRQNKTGDLGTHMGKDNIGSQNGLQSGVKGYTPLVQSIISIGNNINVASHNMSNLFIANKAMGSQLLQNGIESGVE